MDKATLRSQVWAARRKFQESMSKAQWLAQGESIADAVAAERQVLSACRTRATIAAYSSYGTEPPTDALIARLASMGATVVLPIIRTPEDPLLWADASSPLKPDVRGIPTPAGNVVARNAADLLAINCRVIIVPALGVAKDGTRLGQGGGYYDRLLRHFPSHASISGGPLRLTIVNESEVFDELPSDPHDQRVDRWVIA